MVDIIPKNGLATPNDAGTIEAIEAKNQEERAKRVNKKGFSQFREATGPLAKFGADLWAQGSPDRAPKEEDVDVLIVGCGHGGIIAAKRLHDAGIHNIRMVDKASDFGGVWYWNRYPGLYCDTEAYIYLPFLEETGKVPSNKYVPGHEIQSYAISVAEREGLRPKAFFQTEVEAIAWNDSLSRWIGRTDKKDVIRARFVVSAIGILHKLHLPGIRGIEGFQGKSFHTARWDYTYTGGNRLGAPLDKIQGKRVGLIGTGGSTIQALPHLAASGAEVYVFQRTPSSVDERKNSKTDEIWYASMSSKSGWQVERSANFDDIINGADPGNDMIDDGWTRHIYNVHSTVNGSKETFQEALKVADITKMEGLRNRVDDIVKDKTTAEGLKAWYGRTCKRPCFNDDYLESFNFPNVHLVHTDGQGVDEVNKAGVVAAGTTYELDCIIYATGFDWGNDYSARANMKITGRDGLVMSEKWQTGPRTLHGMIGRDFPNLLIFTHLQSSPSSNYTHLLSERAKQATFIISEAFKRGYQSIEPTQQAEDAWVRKLEDRARLSLAQFKQCTPGYLNNEGQISEENLRNTSAGLTMREWSDIVTEWRAEGNFAGLEIDRKTSREEQALL